MAELTVFEIASETVDAAFLTRATARLTRPFPEGFAALRVVRLRAFGALRFFALDFFEELLFFAERFTERFAAGFFFELRFFERVADFLVAFFLAAGIRLSFRNSMSSVSSNSTVFASR